METIRIADFGTVITGKTPSSNNPEHFGEDYPFITPTDMDAGRIVHTERRISEEGYVKFRHQILPRHSVCFVCIGATIGKICLTTERSLTNQQINSIIVDNTRHNPFFVYYLLSTYAERVKSIAGGAATPIVNKTSFENIEVVVPALPIQRKIAVILSAYDDLIENNLWRIKILEEMAQNLYREWFVKFRFPGYQHARFTDSPLGRIPEGWEVKRLGEITDISWGDTSTTKASYVEEGYDAYSASGLDGKLDHYDCDRIGIVLSAIGARCGKTWLARGKWSCIKNTIRFWSKDECVSTVFLFIATKGQVFWPRRGAAQPFISQGDAERIELLIPDPEMMKCFTKFAADALEQIATTQAQIQNLRRTRDMLLPRLISGELDVSELDIAVPEET